MKILITGANGQLGRQLWKVLSDTENEIICTDVWDRQQGFPTSFLNQGILYLDITNEDMVETMLGAVKPDIVINCAAHTAVDLCEDQPEAAYKINATGPYNLARALNRTGGTLVQISTDYVFDGNGQRPYVEEDEPNPATVYGSTKHQGEIKVQENISKYFIIRTAWLYGDGKNFVRTMLRLSKDHTQLKVVADQKGSPTSTKELAKMIVNLINTDKYGIYHGTCEGETTWCEFAKTIFEMTGTDCEVIPVSTKEYGAKAKRPEYSVLENKNYNALGFKKLKHWREALGDYLEEEIIR